MRKFETGATRDSDDEKLDYEGFISPLVTKRFAEYMHKHRFQADGKVRASDNWQKGMPLEAYMKSLWRHFMDLWLFHRSYSISDHIEDVLCAILFNVQGYLHELLKNNAKYRDVFTSYPDVSYLLPRVDCFCTSKGTCANCL